MGTPVQKYIQKVIKCESASFSRFGPNRLIELNFQLKNTATLIRRYKKLNLGVRVFFLKIGTHTKFDLGKNPLGLFLLFGQTGTKIGNLVLTILVISLNNF